jgi:hypothetical protein
MNVTAPEIAAVSERNVSNRQLILWKEKVLDTGFRSAAAGAETKPHSVASAAAHDAFTACNHGTLSKT